MNLNFRATFTTLFNNIVISVVKTESTSSDIDIVRDVCRPLLLKLNTVHRPNTFLDWYEGRLSKRSRQFCNCSQ